MTQRGTLRRKLRQKTKSFSYAARKFDIGRAATRAFKRRAVKPGKGAYAVAAFVVPEPLIFNLAASSLLSLGMIGRRRRRR
jgi:hypothetical protein